MTLLPSNFQTQIPQPSISTTNNNNLSKPHFKFAVSFHNRNYPKSKIPISCLSNCDQKTNEMEKNGKWVSIESDGDDEYVKELDVAVKAVHVACLLCQKVQENLIFNGDKENVQSKDDNSPVTIAGNFHFFFFLILVLCVLMVLC